MTVKEAIAWLSRIQAKHGDDILVYFDCPKCDGSFTPGTVGTVAVHLPGEPPQAAPETPCDHKFIDSQRCLKCGWMPHWQQGKGR